jgi:hypothetical protein
MLTNALGGLIFPVILLLLHMVLVMPFCAMVPKNQVIVCRTTESFVVDHFIVQLGLQLWKLPMHVDTDQHL